MAYLSSTDFPSVARYDASVLQLAAPHRRRPVWTRIFNFLTRTIRSPEVARLAGDFNLTRILPSDKFVHHFEVILDCLADVVERFLLRHSLREAPWQAWTRDADAFLGFLKDHFVRHDKPTLSIVERVQTPCLRLAIRKRRRLRETAAGCPLI